MHTTIDGCHGDVVFVFIEEELLRVCNVVQWRCAWHAASIVRHATLRPLDADVPRAAPLEAPESLKWRTLHRDMESSLFSMRTIYLEALRQPCVDARYGS